MMTMAQGIGKIIRWPSSLRFWKAIKERSNNPGRHTPDAADPAKGGNPGNHPDKRISSDEHSQKPRALANVLSRRLEILKDAIEEIDKKIDERVKLTENFKQQIDAEIEDCQMLLNKLPYPWSEGFQPKMEFIRISLHKSLLTRRKDKRSEELSFWEDLTALMKDKSLQCV